MSRYYVVGLTHRDIMDEIQLRMIRKITHKDVILKTPDDQNDETVLIYSKNTTGEYATLEYIHENIYNQLSGMCALKHKKIIDENELPKDASIVFRLSQLG